jgi:hypothetical protein
MAENGWHKLEKNDDGAADEVGERRRSGARAVAHSEDSVKSQGGFP